MLKETSQEIWNYIIYPSIVIGIGGLGALITNSVIKYFNKLNLTLTELNKSIQLIILDQTKIHGEQDKNIAIMNEELHTTKVIQREQSKYINELYNITEQHNLAIEILKQVKEDK